MSKSAYTKVFLALSFLTMGLTIGFNFFVDPFTYYHQPWTPINISKNHRYSNPGIARQYDYQTVLVGTSLSMGLESSRLSELSGRPSINLSISAGLIREKADLIELALEQGKADTVLWEMHFPSFAFGDVVGDARLVGPDGVWMCAHGPASMSWPIAETPQWTQVAVPPRPSSSSSQGPVKSWSQSRT